MKNRKWNYYTQDPLHFDHSHKPVNGGIKILVDHLHDSGKYRLPLKNMAYLIYNMTFDNIYDPLVYEKFEANYKITSGKHMNARIAFGAIYAYYKSNQGTLFGVDFWESIHEDHIDGMHVAEISRLLEAFRENRQLQRSHVVEKLDTHYKGVMLKKWKEEVEFNQRTLFDLAKELDNIGWYDEEVWTMIFDTALHKKRINNTYDFDLILSIMKKMNNNEADIPHFYQKVQTKIDDILKKHYTGQVDRMWRYNADKAEFRSLKEL
jgi:hypothetical protein